MAADAEVRHVTGGTLRVACSRSLLLQPWADFFGVFARALGEIGGASILWDRMRNGLFEEAERLRPTHPATAARIKEIAARGRTVRSQPVGSGMEDDTSLLLSVITAVEAATAGRAGNEPVTIFSDTLAFAYFARTCPPAGAQHRGNRLKTGFLFRGGFCGHLVVNHDKIPDDPRTGGVTGALAALDWTKDGLRAEDFSTQRLHAEFGGSLLKAQQLVHATRQIAARRLGAPAAPPRPPPASFSKKLLKLRGHEDALKHLLWGTGLLLKKSAADLYALAECYWWLVAPRLRARGWPRWFRWWDAIEHPLPAGAPPAEDVPASSAAGLLKFAGRKGCRIGSRRVGVGAGALRGAIPDATRVDVANALEAARVVVDSNVSFTRAAWALAVVKYLRVWAAAGAAGADTDAPSGAPPTFTPELFVECCGYHRGRAPDLFASVADALIEEHAFDYFAASALLANATLFHEQGKMWATEIDTILGAGAIHGAITRVRVFWRWALLRELYYSTMGDGADVTFAAAIISSPQRLAALADACTDMTYGITHTSPAAGGAAVPLRRPPQVQRALAHPRVAALVQRMAGTLWGGAGDAGAVNRVFGRLAPPLAGQPATRERFDRLLSGGALVWRLLRMFKFVSDYDEVSRGEALDVSRAGPRAVAALLRAENAYNLACAAAGQEGDEEGGDAAAAVAGAEVFEEETVEEREAAEAAAARYVEAIALRAARRAAAAGLVLDGAAALALARANAARRRNVFPFPYPDGLTLRPLLGVGAQALGTLVSPFWDAAADGFPRLLGWQQYASVCDYFTLYPHHMGYLTITGTGDVHAPHNIHVARVAPGPAAAAVAPLAVPAAPAPAPPGAPVFLPAGAPVFPGGPVHPACHAKVLRENARGKLTTVGCDLGMKQQTYSRKSVLTDDNVTTKYTTALFEFLSQRQKFAAKRRRLLAQLSAAQRYGAKRPLSFSEVPSAVDARLAAPAPAAILKQLAKLDKRRAIMHKRALHAILMDVRKGSVEHGTATGGRTRIAVVYGKPTFLGGAFPILELVNCTSTIVRGPAFYTREFNSTALHGKCHKRQQDVYRDARKELRYNSRGALTGNPALVARLSAHYVSLTAATAAGAAPPALQQRWGHVEVGGLKYCPTCRQFVSRDANSAEIHRMFLDTYLAGRPRPAPFTPEGRALLGPKLPHFYLGGGEGLPDDVTGCVFEMDPATRAAALGALASAKKLLRGTGMAGAFAGMDADA